jgi:hypothetical protein
MFHRSPAAAIIFGTGGTRAGVDQEILHFVDPAGMLLRDLRGGRLADQQGVGEPLGRRLALDGHGVASPVPVPLAFGPALVAKLAQGRVPAVAAVACQPNTNASRRCGCAAIPGSASGPKPSASC